MTTEKAAEKRLPGWKRLYGWWAIVPSLCVNTWGGYGMFYTSSAPFVTSWMKAFGWSRTVATGAYSVGNLFQVTGPFLGVFMDRVGYRKANIVGVSVMIIGALLLVFVNKDASWMVYVGYVLLCSIGLNIPTGASKAINFWFLKRRGLVIGIVTMMTGTVYLSAAAQGYFIEQYGLMGGGWYIFGLGVAMLLVTIFVIRDKASDMGVGLDGMLLLAKAKATDGGQKAPPKPAAKKEEKAVAKFTYEQAMRTPTIWVMFFSYSFLVQLCNTLIVGNYVPFLQGLGISAAAAGLIWGFMGFFGWPSRFLWGPIMDWMGRGNERWLYAASIAMMAIAVMGLIQVRGPQDFFWVWWWTAWWGFGYGGCMTALQVILSTYYGPAVYGFTFGLKGVFQGVAGFIGPLLGGVIYDITGSYSLAFWIIVVALVVATTMMCFASAPKINPDGTPLAKT